MKNRIILLGLLASLYTWAVPPRVAGIGPDPYAQQVAKTVAAHANKRFNTADTIVSIPRILVIIANYSDWECHFTRQNFDSMFNATQFTLDGATGSIRQYIYDQSNGAYNPQFDVYGPVTLSHNALYYGQGDNDKAGIMVAEACALVDSAVNFSLYDSDNDGNVDLVYVVYAGPPASDGMGWRNISNPDDLVWPHYWNLTDAGCGGLRRTFDHKTINDYEVSGELDGYYSTETQIVMSGIGVACHEFGHALGLPDVYTTNNSSHRTSGMWDIMDYGCYNNDVHTPAGYTAYERFYLGWLTPRVLNETENVTLHALNTSNQALLISASGTHNLVGNNPNPSSFYLLENRQQTGWDEYLPGEGMLVTKIQYDYNKWHNNVVNNSENDMGIDIIEADGLKSNLSTSNWYGKPGDCFPIGATKFTPYSAYPITQITQEGNGDIQFVFMDNTTMGLMDERENDDQDWEYFDLMGRKVKWSNTMHGMYIRVNKQGVQLIER